MPGVAIAGDAEALYLRDARWTGETLEHVLHRVTIAGRGAQIDASLDLPKRPSSALVTSAGQIAVTLHDDCYYCSLSTTTLWLLDAATLEPRGELEVELPDSARIVAQSGSMLVLEAPGGGLALIDLSDPRRPALTRSLSHAQLADLRDGRLLYLRGGALHSLAL